MENEKDAKQEKELKAQEQKTAQEEAVIDECNQTVEGNEEQNAASANGEDSKIDELTNKCADLLDKYQRSLAEFDNFRKRTIKEKASMYDDGVRETVEKLLPVVDNFERAMAAREGHEEDGFYTGIKMIFKQLQEVLKALGVEEIPALGEKFDPAFHAAVAHVEDEAYGENEVILDMQKGYKYKDKVIRHSMVKVAN